MPTQRLPISDAQIAAGEAMGQNPATLTGCLDWSTVPSWVPRDGTHLIAVNLSAAFLAMNPGPDGRPEIPDAVLFNGGIMASESVRRRIIDLLSGYLARQRS